MERHRVSPADLFSLGVASELETVIEAVAAGRNVAVVAPPLAGRAAVLDIVEGMAGESVREQATERTDAADAPIRLYEDCHRLYLRHIGGFSELDAFLDGMAETSAVHVTTWNAYAWAYLNQAKSVGNSFDSVITLDKPDSETVTSWLESLAADGLTYVRDSADGPSGFDPQKIHSLTTLREQLRLLCFADGDDDDPRAAVFESVTRIAGGNPGVAKTIWNAIETEAATEGEVRTSMVTEHEAEVSELSYGDAYALLTVLANGSITQRELEAAVDESLDRTLRRFEKQGVVELTGDGISVAPPALKPVVEHLTNRRLLW